MSVGDRLFPNLSQGFTPYKSTNETLAQGLNEAAMNVQGVAGGTAMPVSGTVSLPNEGQQTMANSISVAVASDQSAVPVSGTVTNKPTGAPNYANGQVTAGVASGVLVAARATRRSVVIRNQDTANSVYIGAGTVTSGNGLLLKGGESIAVDTVAAINCIRDTADCAVGFMETFD